MVKLVRAIELLLELPTGNRHQLARLQLVVEHDGRSEPRRFDRLHAVGHVFGPIADGEKSVVLEQLSDIAPCVPGDSFQRFVSIHP